MQSGVCLHSQGNGGLKGIYFDEPVSQVYGKTGEHSLDYWTPPSCMAATPEPTTTTPAPTTLLEEGALARALEKNKALKETITGLKQQYSSIGQRVYKAIKESIFHSFEAYLAKEKVTNYIYICYLCF